MTQSENARVWASRAFMDSTRIKAFTADLLPTGMSLGQMAELNEAGEPMSAEHFPKEIFAKYPDKKEKKLADLVLAAGAVVVSAACAEVLRQFELGHSSLYPIKLFQHDRKTPVEGDYFCLNIGERKDTFLRQYSQKVMEFGDGTVSMWPNLHDDEVAVSPAALEGPDLWVSPPLNRIFFLSGRLTQALRAAKMGRVFGFAPAVSSKATKSSEGRVSGGAFCQPLRAFSRAAVVPDDAVRVHPRRLAALREAGYRIRARQKPCLSATFLVPPPFPVAIAG
ncbi:hypothetical protein [Rhizobium bangladeshense]|uniref:hypothetical protein n=1 Tax=Rhizobium bangladeshense TaxID=1138189 RepID=UPI0007E553BD|nr:hypothetical protein [Rhizobium bangladeshense]